jgi:serpin B
MKPKFLFYLMIGLACCLNAAAAPSPNVQKVVAGNTQFAVNLYDKLDAGDGNLFFSPFSISTALAMTSGGARGETARQMAQVLQFSLPAEELHPAFAELGSELKALQATGNVQIDVANSLWPQSGFPMRQKYLAFCEKYYGTSINPVDYKEHAEDARKKINDWVEDKTHKKIVDLLKPGVLNAATRLVLVNAIYFKGDWAKPFKAAQTHDEPFHVTAGTDVKAPLMQQTESFGYAEFPDLQVLELPYASNELSMVVLLPRKVDGIGSLEKQLTTENLILWTDKLEEQKVHVFLPKFTATSEFSLRGTLSGMGMTDAFTGNADFSGMDGKKDLFISDVIHKAYVKVDEEGTEAAAATAVIVRFGAMPPPAPPTPTFRADHSFLFFIRDNRTGSILFLGRVTNPAK